MTRALPVSYYAVVFTSELGADTAGYEAMAARMVELAQQQPGFLGIESARSGLGITVSYWRDLASIAAWREHVEHLTAQRLGRERWYQSYRLRIARVEVARGVAPVGASPCATGLRCSEGCVSSRRSSGRS